jgi:hypothetical protein
MELFISLRSEGAEFVTQKKGNRKNEETGFRLLKKIELLVYRTFGPCDGTIILDFP